MDEHEHREGRPVQKRQINAQMVALIVVAVLLVVFVLANTGSVTIGFVLTDAEMPLFLALIITAALGFAAGWIVSVVRARRAH